MGDAPDVGPSVFCNRAAWRRAVFARSAPGPRAVVSLEPIRHFRQLVLAGEIIETRDGGVELQIDGTSRPVALLADDDLSLAVHGGHLGLPFDVLVGPG